MNVYEVIRRPLVTEKGVDKKDDERTLCFEVAPTPTRRRSRQAVEKLFKVKVAEVRTANFAASCAGAAVLRLPFGLEEGVRDAEGGREDAGVRGDLSHADQDISDRQPRPAASRRWSRARTSPRRRRKSRWSIGKKRTGGRNSTGRVISRASSAAATSRLTAMIDFKRDKAGIPAVVAAIEYDPNRSARIALLNYADGEKRYILQPGRA